VLIRGFIFLFQSIGSRCVRQPDFPTPDSSNPPAPPPVARSMRWPGRSLPRWSASPGPW